MFCLIIDVIDAADDAFESASFPCIRKTIHQAVDFNHEGAVHAYLIQIGHRNIVNHIKREFETTAIAAGDIFGFEVIGDEL